MCRKYGRNETIVRIKTNSNLTFEHVYDIVYINNFIHVSKYAYFILCLFLSIYNSRQLQFHIDLNLLHEGRHSVF